MMRFLLNSSAWRGSFFQLIILTGFILFLTLKPTPARSFRPGLIPNGNSFSCSNCHFNAGGGGARNPFGQAVEALVSPGGSEQFWSASLAAQD